MKTLSPQHPLIIVMLGAPGAGKSFFARQFSETFGAPLVSYDRIRYELFNQPHYAKEEEEIIGRVALLQIQELIKTGKTFIIDGGMNSRAARAAIAKFSRPHGYKNLIIWVQTDTTTSRTRATHRNQKQPYDAYNSSLTPDLYATLTKRVTEPATHEPFLVISGKHTYATQAKMVLKRIVAEREEGVVAIQPPVVRPERDPISPAPEPRKNVMIQ